MHQLEAGLRAQGVSFVPSRGNFVLIEVGDAAAIYQSLLRQGVIVRPVANYGLPGFLRVTVGTRGENERFLAALATARQTPSLARAH
jgi:histidinol-phosphate aminotransferase